MNYRTDKHLTEFKFWSGAKQHYFTYAELQQLDKNLTELFCEKTPTETDINDLFWFEEELLCELIGTDFNEYENRQDMIKISITAGRQIRNSDKTFFLYRLNENKTKVVDFILTDNLSKFRDHYNNKFKLVDDIKKKIKYFKIEL